MRVLKLKDTEIWKSWEQQNEADEEFFKQWDKMGESRENFQHKLHHLAGISSRFTD